MNIINTLPDHYDACPDAYLFEFSGDPGTAEATKQINLFKAKITGMKSAYIRQEFRLLLNGISAHIPDKDELRQLADLDGILSITPLTIVSPPKKVETKQNDLVASAHNMIGVTRVHTELKLTGEGVKVGVIDTGIDYTHPALGGCFGSGCKIAYGHDFVGDNYDGNNEFVPSNKPMDCAGHGTHVAGIIAASSEVFTGVAPRVTLGAYKIIGCNGTTSDDIIIAALERAAKDNMDIINMSIGFPDGWPENKVAKAIDRIQSKGIMVIASQGNESQIPSSPERQFAFKKPDTFGLNGTHPILALLNGTELGNGCDPIKENLKDQVLLVSRGECTYQLKAQNALRKGAIGILVVNNVEDSLFQISLQGTPMMHGGITKGDGLILFNYLKSIHPMTPRGRRSMSLTEATVISFYDDPVEYNNPAGGTMSLYSTYGLDNELHIKPDIGAPGENIYSTWPVKNGSYITLSGTSMATPHIAGAMALSLQQLRILKGSDSWTLTPEQIQRIYATFKNTAKPAYVFRNHTSDITSGNNTDPKSKQSKNAHSKEISSAREETPFLESVAKQGAGMADIYRALTSLVYRFKSELIMKNSTNVGYVSEITSTYVDPAIIELNDTVTAALETSINGGREGQTRYITISNYGPKAVQYELSHIPAEGLHELAIENKSVKLRSGSNNTLLNETGPSVVTAGVAPVRVEFSMVKVVVPGNSYLRVAMTFYQPIGIPADEHWIYSGYIVVRTMESDSNNTISTTNINTTGYSSPASSSQLADAIHVPYAGVVGSMKTLPIFLRPTETEIRTNSQTALCQILKCGIDNKTDFVYTFKGDDFPVLSYCLQNPTSYLILELITASETSAPELDNNNNDPEGTIDREDYKVLGQVQIDEKLSRNGPGNLAKSVQWDGTLLNEAGESRKSNKKESQAVELFGDSSPLSGVPRLESVHGTQVQPEGEGVMGRYVQSQAALEQMIDDRDDGMMLERRSKHKDKGDSLTKQKKNTTKNIDHSKSSKKKIQSKDSDKKNIDKSEESYDRQKHPAVVPNGRYRLRLRALRMLGDPEKAEDYDYWITRSFTVQRTQPIKKPLQDDPIMPM
ncbi:hypothetical protein FBU30_009362 [Linnemannia zychae]|nr:hypothetical protein FBU30_009362 [Linnemannia zychae]